MKTICIHRAPWSRQLLTLLLVSLLAVSCGQDDLALQTGQKPLSFVTLSKNIKPAARATYSGVFGTTVYHANTVDELNSLSQKNAGKIYDGIDNLPVSLRNGVWTTETDKYWPGSGGILVVAYSPYSNNATKRATMPYNMHSPYVYAATTLNDQTDLLFADVEWLPVNTSSDSPVPVKFNHALAMVTFQVSVATMGVGEDSWKIFLKEARLENVRKKGGVTISNNGHNYWTTNNEGAWNVAEDGTYETDISFTGNVQLTSTPLAVLDKKILMPQKLLAKTESNCQNLVLSYTIETTRTLKDPDGNTHTQVTTEEINDKRIPLRTDKINIWQMGQHITYNITFNSGQPIEFTGSASPWQNEKSDIIVF